MPIHIFYEQADSKWQVWLDTEEDTERDGICIGAGPTLKAALNLARAEITVADSTLNIYSDEANLKVEQPTGLTRPLPPTGPEKSELVTPTKGDVPF